VVRGWEADDEVTIISHKYGHDPDRVCIVSVDKDHRTVPGRLFNFRSRKFSIITEEEARTAFYRQLLTGDTTDNIVGCYRCGETGAAKLIQPSMTEQEMAYAALGEYQRSLARAGCPYAHMGAMEAMRENGTLLWLLRDEVESMPGRRWEPPLPENPNFARGTSARSGPTLTIVE